LTEKNDVKNKVNLPRKPESISNEILETIQTVGQSDLAWLNGYCAGLFDARINVSENDEARIGYDSQDYIVEDEQSILEQSLTVKILYGSQTGNAQAIAESLYERISGSGHTVSLENLEQVNSKKLSESSVLIFVVSTHGEGEPPDDAIEFFEALQSRRAPKLERTKHAILSLGDSSYEFFCQTGKDLDSLLCKAGSTSAIARVDCDLDYEQDSQTWFQSIEDFLNFERVQSSETIYLKTSENATSLDKVEPRYNKRNPFGATVLTNQRITASDSNKEVHHLELLIEGSGLDYLPGDSVSIWAKNDSRLVDEILQQLAIPSEQMVVISGESISVKEALTEHLEITLLNKKMVENYGLFIKELEPELFKIFETDILANYSNFIANHQFVDLALSFPIKLSATQLVELLNPIKPRVYSISSSLLVAPDELHITVKLEKMSNQKSIRYGAASRYLIEDIQVDQELKIFIESNARFKLPNDDSPIIMIGPGTGIAPFRGFLQQRSVLAPGSNNWLFFGNAHFNSEFLYQVELQKYLDKGILTRLDVAFSRDQEEKIYVQDRLWQAADDVWLWLNEKNATLYVCGDMKHMAKDVEATLLNIIQSRGELSVEDAKQYLKQLHKQKRYQRDIY
jgi:sulfite reductase (NADPH) flavoprotein alpha-component